MFSSDTLKTIGGRRATRDGARLSVITKQGNALVRANGNFAPCPGATAFR